MLFRLIYFENSGNVFPSEITLNAEDAAAHLATEHWLHQKAGWETSSGADAASASSPRSRGRPGRFTWRRNGDEESIALAIGLLQPASRKDGRLEEVTA